jgi:uncharacterized membrane protein YbhN (UPF0104 family)
MLLNSKALRPLISILTLALFSVWVVWYAAGHWQDFAVITEVAWPNLLGLYLLFAAILLVNGLYTRYVLTAFGVDLRLKEWVFLSIASTATNYITFFRGGAGVRALYLKFHYQFSFTDFLSTLSAMYIMYFLFNGALGLAGMALLTGSKAGFNLLLTLAFAGLTVLSAAVMLLNIRLPEYGTFPFRQIALIINGWDVIRKNRVLCAKLLGNTALYTLLMVLQTKLAFFAYGVKLSWGAVFCFTSLKGLALLAAVTPGSLGIVEWLSVYLSRILPYTGSEALMAQALMRVVTLTTLLVTGPIAVRYLGGHLLTRQDRKAGQEEIQ